MAMLHLFEDCNLWKDFPKGLHVLVVDKDAQALHDIKAKLEECKYEVTAFERGEDAVSALGNPSSSFHVALVEAAIGEGLDGFSILISAKKHNNIPTIMMSDKENREVMMRAFALGAVEFLQKPLSDEKLKNVWQHAVRKALARGEKTHPQSLDTTPMNSQSASSSDQIAGDEEVESEDTEEAGFTIEGKPHEKISAPSTPQQELSDILNSREETNGEDTSGSESLMHNAKIQSEENQFSDGGSSISIDEVKKDSLSGKLQTSTESAANADLNYFDKMEMDFDDFCLGDGDLNLSDLEIDPDMLADFSLENHGELDMDLYCLDHCEVLDKDLAEEEALLLAEVSKAEKEQQFESIPDNTTTSSDSSDVKDEVLSDDKKSKGAECLKIGFKNHHGKRKVKVDWTADLHRRFVQAVEQLGIDKAVPSRILELMGVNCLTRHNIASHLQKYRSHRKHLLAREAEAASWNHKRQLYATPGTRSRREVSPWIRNSGNTLIQPRPPIVYPPATHPPPFRPLHVWGHPTVDHSMVHMWYKQPFPSAPWPAADGTYWQHQQACTDTWGHNAPAPGTPCYPHPLVRLPLAPVAGVPHFNPPVFNGNHFKPEDSSPIHPVQIDVMPATLHPPKETVDAAINEVLSNPWTPLPIGLNPPSLESVMAALQRKGISNVPPASTCLAR